MGKVTVQHFAFLIYDTKSEMKYPLTEAVVVFQWTTKILRFDLFILCIFRSGCIASHLLRRFITHQFLDPFTLMFWFMFPQSLIGSELWGACFSLSGLISLSLSHIQNSLLSCLHSISCWGQCSFLWKLSPRSIATCQDAFQQTPVRLCHACLSKMGSSGVQFLHGAQFCSESKNPTMIHCYSSIFLPLWISFWLLAIHRDVRKGTMNPVELAIGTWGCFRVIL